MNRYLLIQTIAGSSETWELAKSVMLILITAASLWTARTVFSLRDSVRALQTMVSGANGTNGLVSRVKHIELELAKIVQRNLKIDAIAELEREQYQGEERRKDIRRMRDSLLPPIPPVDYGEGEE